MSAAVADSIGRAGPAPAGRYTLIDLLRSEWTKLRTVRSTGWSAVLIVVLSVGVSVLATAETQAHWLTQHHGPTFDPTQLSLIGFDVAQLVIGVLGVLVISAEYGTGTIRASFSAAPRRPMVLAAKVGVFSAAALVLSEVVAFVSFLVGQALLSSPARHATLSTPGALRAVVGSGLYICVIGLIGLGLGLIIRHTAGALGAFVGVLLIFPLVVSALPQSLINAIQRYEPLQIGKTMSTVVQLSHRTGQVFAKIRQTGHAVVVHVGTNPPVFSPWAGFGMLCVYAVALLAIGTVLLVRRDA
jgi:ABC-2 type transport system permease protein